jgi:hypothetical protein
VLSLCRSQFLSQSRLDSSAIEMVAVKGPPASPLDEAPPPIPPKSDARQSVIRRLSRKKEVFTKRNKSNPRTQPQTVAQSTSQARIPRSAAINHHEASTTPNEFTSDDDDLYSRTFPELAHTTSTRTSYSSPVAVRPGSPIPCASTHALPDPSDSSSRTCLLKRARARYMVRRRRIWMILLSAKGRGMWKKGGRWGIRLRGL